MVTCHIPQTLHTGEEPFVWGCSSWQHRVKLAPLSVPLLVGQAFKTKFFTKADIRNSLNKGSMEGGSGIQLNRFLHLKRLQRSTVSQGCFVKLVRTVALQVGIRLYFLYQTRIYTDVLALTTDS